jgi:NADH:ubiquinone oxidoreductase subunit 6 (subunit J)
MSANAENIGKAESLGAEMFTNYGLSIVLAGILLLAAIVGAAVLAKKKFE